FALSALLFVTGVCSGAFYPLGLALLGERLPTADIPRANAWYLGVNCLGCLVSPVISGPVMKAFGRVGMFYTGEMVVLAVLAVWMIRRMAAKWHKRTQKKTPNRVSAVR